MKKIFITILICFWFYNAYSQALSKTLPVVRWSVYTTSIQPTPLGSWANHRHIDSTRVETGTALPFMNQDSIQVYCYSTFFPSIYGTRNVSRGGIIFDASSFPMNVVIDSIFLKIYCSSMSVSDYTSTNPRVAVYNAPGIFCDTTGNIAEDNYHDEFWHMVGTRRGSTKRSGAWTIAGYSGYISSSGWWNIKLTSKTLPYLQEPDYLSNRYVGYGIGDYTYEYLDSPNIDSNVISPRYDIDPGKTNWRTKTHPPELIVYYHLRPRVTPIL